MRNVFDEDICWDVLEYLFINPPSNHKLDDICDSLQIYNEADVVEALSLLCAAGLVRYDDDTKMFRYRLIDLTETGTSICRSKLRDFDVKVKATLSVERTVTVRAFSHSHAKVNARKIAHGDIKLQDLKAWHVTNESIPNVFAYETKELNG